MYQLIYISDARPGLSSDEIDNILDASRKNNALADISGVLVAAGGKFLQALEGPFDRVEERFAIIAKDTRHLNVTRMMAMPIERRSFAEWSMGWYNSTMGDPLHDRIRKFDTTADALAIQSGANPMTEALIQFFAERQLRATG